MGRKQVISNFISTFTINRFYVVRYRLIKMVYHMMGWDAFIVSDQKRNTIEFKTDPIWNLSTVMTALELRSRSVPKLFLTLFSRLLSIGFMWLDIG